MSISKPKKTKLTVTVDSNTLNEAKKEAKRKHVPISRSIENFLRFFRKPEVYCSKCGERFNSVEAKLCPKCGICRCDLSEEAAIAVFYTRKIYEELLIGRVKQN